jgi:hypothetical protein
VEVDVFDFRDAGEEERVVGVGGAQLAKQREPASRARATNCSGVTSTGGWPALASRKVCEIFQFWQ